MRKFVSGIGPSFIGCVLALVAVRFWDKYGWKVAIVLVPAFIGWEAFGAIKYVWDGHRGLGQWPDPHGRFYQEWMSLPPDETRDDYYQWLSRQMCNREPWRKWAEMERNLGDGARDCS